MQRLTRGRRSLMVWLGPVLFLWAICSLPYRIPGARVYSESYAFGYNNRVAAAITAGAAVLLALFGPKLRLQFAPGKPLHPGTLRSALAVSGFLSGGLALLTHGLDGAGESIYLIDRIRLLAEGRVPYREFEYAYGASFLYVPVWMSRLFHVSAGDAYGIFWVVLVLLGTYLLYETIRGLEVPGSAKRAVFLLFWAFSLPCLLSFGITYTLFRYALPCYLGTVLYRRLFAGRDGGLSAGAMLWVVPMYALLLVVSQELALAFAAGVSGFLMWFGSLRRGAHLAAFAGMLAGVGGVTLLAARMRIFSTLQAFSSGGFNIPLRPAPHLLLFFFLLALTACYAGDHLRRREPTGLFMLIAVSAPSVAAALGRCDPLHVLPNPLGVTLAGSLLLLGLPHLRRFLWPAMWVVFPVLYTLTVALESGPQLAKTALPALLVMTPPALAPKVDGWVLGRMTRALGAEAAGEKFRAIQAGALSHTPLDVAARFRQPPGTVFEAPFGFAPGRFGTYHSPAIDEGYYFENENVLTPDAVQRKVREMQDHPERPLLLLPGRARGCVLGYSRAPFAIGPPFYYPYMARPVHVLDVTEPMCAYIRENYHLSSGNPPETFGYLLWLPDRVESR